MLLQNLEDIFTERPDKVLYHYTDQKGLYGILREGEIWASHSQYLNDSEEYKCAISLVRRHIEKRIQRECDSIRKQHLEFMRKFPEEVLREAYICVCSFSEADDSLPQWRAYGSSASGFAIGFDPEGLAKALEKRRTREKYSMRIGRCRYKKLEQNKIAKLIVEQALQENRGLTEIDTIRQFGGYIGQILHQYAPIIKHNSFKDEQEWRVIIGPISPRNKCIDHRPGTSMLIPYYKLSLKDEKGQLPLKRIVIGPTPHKKQSVSSVKGFLKNLGYPDNAVEVVPSKVPFRNW